MKHLAYIIILLAALSCKTEPKKETIVETEIVQEYKHDSINSIPIISHKTSTDNIQFFLKDKQGQYYNNHGNLLADIKKQGMQLKFAMNGGMYLQDYSPQGLYIEKGVELKSINTKKSNYGNFYLEPNGIFYIQKDGKAFVTQTQSFKKNSNIKYATQSGPMLVIDGKLHTSFIKGSKHLHIRNGVGILPKGDLLFAMSKDSINFYDFATYFKEQGCKNALYLDGAISKTYLPSKGVKQTRGRFGVIIGEVE